MAKPYSTKYTMLQQGQRYESDIGLIEVVTLLGAGTQGEVYQVILDNTPMALKIYLKNQVDHDVLQSIQSLIDIGAPNQHFLWPSYLVMVHGFHGYLMPLIEKRYTKMSHWMLRKFDMNFKEIITSCLQLTEAFHQLHAKGLSYQDISLNNVMIDPTTGDVLIIDNDNITTNHQSISGISGTDGFMAPELVEGDIFIPNADTDRYSLLVFLFHLLFVSNPFHGQEELSIKCYDGPAKLKLYGHQGVFIFHPNDRSNRPDQNLQQGVIKLWEFYPDYIKDLFIRGFTDGHKFPHKRPRESEIKRVFIKFQQSLYHCSCGDENFYDLTYLKKHQTHRPCACGKTLDPSRLKINQDIMMISPQKPFLDLYLNPQIDVDHTKHLLTFKKEKHQLLMTNHMYETIQRKTKTLDVHDVMPTETSVIKDGDQLMIKGYVAYVRIP